MTSSDELDGTWRDGLSAAASELVIADDPRTRVAERVRRRRRSRRTRTAVTLVVLSAAAVLAVAQMGHQGTHPGVAAGPGATVRAVVEVDDAPGNQLTIVFPGRVVSGNPPSIRLPSGLIRFKIQGSAGHTLVIDGIPGFVADFSPSGPTTLTEDVRLNPGEYLMHCAVPGHAEAGEEMLLKVSTQGK
ncbi:MAG: hypothetical protein M3Q30_22710 [Actinomycetota bacterium]|nr:hypothetical protein [Actinomycetota bacterium]